MSGDYAGVLTSYSSDAVGVIVTQEVQFALDDPGNEEKYFYVQIWAMPPKSVTEQFSMAHYVYCGRTIAEWSELMDLADDTYPYREYNRDHGGGVTEEEWKAAVAEAKTLNAKKTILLQRMRGLPNLAYFGRKSCVNGNRPNMTG